MSSVMEIEDAIAQLPENEREQLEARLLAKRFGADNSYPKAYAELLRSLDQAEREIDDGQSFTAADLAKDVRAWAKA